MKDSHVDPLTDDEYARLQESLRSTRTRDDALLIIRRIVEENRRVLDMLAPFEGPTEARAGRPGLMAAIKADLDEDEMALALKEE